LYTHLNSLYLNTWPGTEVQKEDNVYCNSNYNTQFHAYGQTSDQREESRHQIALCDKIAVATLPTVSSQNCFIFAYFFLGSLLIKYFIFVYVT